MWPRITTGRRGILDDVGAYLILGGGIFVSAVVQKTPEQAVTALGRVIGRLRDKRSSQLVNVTDADTNVTFVRDLPEG